MACERLRIDQQFSSSQVIKMLAWDKTSAAKGDGGAQHKALQKAIPTEWTSVAMDDGTAREIRRVVESNPTRHWIETRILKPPPNPTGKAIKPGRTGQQDANVVEFPTPPKPPV